MLEAVTKWSKEEQLSKPQNLKSVPLSDKRVPSRVYQVLSLINICLEIVFFTIRLPLMPLKGCFLR